MEITPDRLIEIALDNLKRKLPPSLAEPISPDALEKLPGSIREAADSLRGKGVRLIRGEDILAEARADLTARLAGSLKAGVLLPDELSPGIVKWLAGTPLAIQIVNRIQAAGRGKIAGGAAAMIATGPVTILARPPDGNGPVYIISKPPGDQSGDNWPINIIAKPPDGNGPVYIISKPPGDQSGDNGPINIIAKPPDGNGPVYIISKPPGDHSGNSGPINIIARPPGDQTGTGGPIYIIARPPSEGSSGGSRRRSRLRGLLPAGLIAVAILVLAGWLAGSVGGSGRPVPTATVGLAIGAGGKIHTVTPSETSVLIRTDTPSVTVTPSPTPTDTLTATPSWTDTPSLTATPAPFFLVIVEPKQIFYRGTGCGEKQARFQVQVAEPEKVAGVWMFVHLINREATEVTGWSGALVMTPEGSGWYAYTLYAEDIPEFAKYRESRVLYQFIAYDRKFKNVAASGVHGDVELSACGR
jgi:hypothetical protein